MEESIFRSLNKRLKGRSIFLVGMMACGKSQTGPKLADLLSYKFIDLDNLVEIVSKKSINQIFHDEGEEVFRNIETNCLKETVKIPSLVISTGGGVVTKSENWGILRQGIIIWIDLNEEIAIKRLNKEINNRPLLKGKDLKKTYSNLLKSRKNLYSQADIRIEINNENIEEVAKKILFTINKKLVD